MRTSEHGRKDFSVPQAITLRQEGLAGGSDRSLYQVCCREQRCLVTLDLDFADVTRFPPGEAAGIAVIRVSKNPNLPLLERLIRELLDAVAQIPIAGELWIVEVGRIRLHQSETGRDS
ncbi:MAG TPA: DUF5615 family PIN-like protein [Bryobacterales bacterium]|nr:DUF5615 family PIN-like protein [Bryobacterales bacterium]